MNAVIAILKDESGSLKHQKVQLLTEFYNMMQEENLFEKYDGSVTFLTFNSRAKTVFKNASEQMEDVQPEFFDSIFDGVESEANSRDDLDEIFCLVITHSCSAEDVSSHVYMLGLEIENMIREKLWSGSILYTKGVVHHIGGSSSWSIIHGFYHQVDKAPVSMSNLEVDQVKVIARTRRRSSSSSSPRHLPYTRSMRRLRSIKRIYDSYFSRYLLKA